MLPTSTTASPRSPRTRAIGLEYWSEHQTKRTHSVSHASFMVDGMEAVILGSVALIAIYLGILKVPEKAPAENGGVRQPTEAERQAAWQALLPGSKALELGAAARTPPVLQPSELEDLRARNEAQQRRRIWGYAGSTVTGTESATGGVSTSGGTWTPSGPSIVVGARPGGGGGLIV